VRARLLNHTKGRGEKFELADEVNAELSSGWEPQAGIASIEAGTSVCLIQALVKRR
jgi:hypothetical protein